MKQQTSTSPKLFFSSSSPRMMLFTMFPTASIADLTDLLTTPRIFFLRSAPTALHTSAASTTPTQTLPEPRRTAPARRTIVFAASFTGCVMVLRR